jgi:hypothetical protein
MAKFFKNHWFYLLIQAVSIGFWIWWLPYAHIPLPGYAVAAIAVLAAVMSVHPDMRQWQKFIWLLLIGAFLVTELRAIRKDRDIAEAQALKDRATQDADFKGMRDTENGNFAATATGLQGAIKGIDSTLTTSNKTLILTQPHAALRFDRFEFSPEPKGNFEANKDYGINYYYGNGGAATAYDIKVLTKMYVSKADDRQSEADLAAQFERSWSNGEAINGYAVLVPNYAGFSSTKRNFTAQEIQDLGNHGTFYFLVRYEFSDDTGRWRTDACRSLQRDMDGKSIDINMIHTCSAFERFRYPVPIKRR